MQGIERKGKLMKVGFTKQTSAGFPLSPLIFLKADLRFYVSNS
jgi:hypothetical protein